MKTKYQFRALFLLILLMGSYGCSTGLKAGCADGFINLNNEGCVADTTGGGAPPSESGDGQLAPDTFTDPDTCLNPAPAPVPDKVTEPVQCFDQVARYLPQNFDATAFVNFDGLNRLVVDTGDTDTNQKFQDMIDRFKESVANSLSPLYVGQVRNIGIAVDAIGSGDGVQNPYAMVVEFKTDALDVSILENLVVGTNLTDFDFFTKSPDGKDDAEASPMQISVTERDGNRVVIHMQKADGSDNSDMECILNPRYLACTSLVAGVANEDQSFYKHPMYARSFSNDVEPNCPQIHAYIKKSEPDYSAQKEPSSFILPFDVEFRLSAYTDPQENIKLIQIKFLGWIVENDIYKWIVRNTTDLNMDVADMIPTFMTWMFSDSTSSKDVTSVPTNQSMMFGVCELQYCPTGTADMDCLTREATNISACNQACSDLGGCSKGMACTPERIAELDALCPN